MRLADRVGERRGAVTPARRVDELDRRIIEALQENGRDSFRRIAGMLGVSEATVRARYARLTSEGVLQVVAVTNPLGLGFDQALVGVKTSGPPSEVADEIARWPEADYVVVTAGQFDLVVEVVASDRRELLALTNRMRLVSSSRVIESADRVTRHIVETYLAPNISLHEYAARSQANEEFDLLRGFAEACREELRQFGLP